MRFHLSHAGKDFVAEFAHFQLVNAFHVIHEVVTPMVLDAAEIALHVGERIEFEVEIFAMCQEVIDGPMLRAAAAAFVQLRVKMAFEMIQQILFFVEPGFAHLTFKAG